MLSPKSSFKLSNIQKVFIFVLCIEVFLLAGAIFQGKFQPATVLVGALSNLTNNEREINNLQPLKINSILSKAAQLKAEDMAKNGYFAHTSPTGKTPWYWLDLAGYKYDFAGENLAIDFNETSDVTNAWMNSPAHRANIMKSSYTEVGSGVATGTYLGKEATFIVQDYANPRVSAGGQNVSTSTKEGTIAKSSGRVLGASTESAPVSTSNKFLYTLGGILLVILILLIFIKRVIGFFKNHPKILNLCLIFIVVLLGYNIYKSNFSNNDGLTTSSVNFSADKAQNK